MQFCTAKIALGGDVGNVMTRDAFSPVSWPELFVIRLMHGDDAVSDVEVIADVPQRPRAERERLDHIYGPEPTSALWGGKNVPNEMGDERIPVKPGVTWFNPLTRQVEIVNQGGVSEKAEQNQEVIKDPTLISQPLAAAPLAGDTETRPFEEDFGAPQGTGEAQGTPRKAKGR